MEEIWKPVITKNEDYTGIYEVSNQGRIRSLKRIIKGKTYQSHILQATEHMNRYCVTLRKDKKTIGYCVHLIVARAFVPNPTNRKTAYFIDGDHHNTWSTNIAWGTNHRPKGEPKKKEIDLDLYRRPDRTGEDILREILSYQTCLLT